MIFMSKTAGSPKRDEDVRVLNHLGMTRDIFMVTGAVIAADYWQIGTCRGMDTQADSNLEIILVLVLWTV